MCHVLGNTNLAGREVEFQEVVLHVLASETRVGRDLGGHSDGSRSCEEKNSASVHGCDHGCRLGCTSHSP